jgi:hypothetical protein
LRFSRVELDEREKESTAAQQLITQPPLTKQYACFWTRRFGFCYKKYYYMIFLLFCLVDMIFISGFFHIEKFEKFVYRYLCFIFIVFFVIENIFCDWIQLAKICSCVNQKDV